MELWAHQVEGLRRLEDSTAQYLAWDMGVGKTLAAIRHIVDNEMPQVLIICPKKVVPVWRKELAKHVPDWPVEIFDKLTGTAARKAQAINKMMSAAGTTPRIVVLTYGTFWRKDMIKELLRWDWSAMIADEVHRLKGISSNQARGATKLGKIMERRIGLSGTPTPNNETDLFAQFRWLEPSLFGYSFTKFKHEWCMYGGPIINGAPRKFIGLRNEEKFHGLLRPYMHVVKKEDVLDLPPVIHETRTIELEPEEKRVYNEIRDEMIAAVGDGVVTAANALVKGLRLAQATAGIASVEQIDGTKNEIVLGDSKVDWFRDFMEDVSPDEPVVVFCLFRKTLDRVRNAARAMGRATGEVSGRADTVKGRWDPLPGEVLVLQWQAGGLGIDLTAGCIGLIMDQTYNGGDYAQAMARMDRSGQTRPVTYYTVVARGTIDLRIAKAVQHKLNVAEVLMREIQR